MLSSRGLPNPGIEPSSPALQADSLPSEPPGIVGTQNKNKKKIIELSNCEFGPILISLRVRQRLVVGRLGQVSGTIPMEKKKFLIFKFQREHERFLLNYSLP